MDIHDFAGRYLRPFRTRGNEIVPMYCPFCRSEDKYTFALNTQDKVYNCLRGKCSASGTFKDLLQHFGVDTGSDYIARPKKSTAKFTTKVQPEAVKYKKPTTVMHELTTQSIKYLQLRKLTEFSWTRYGIKDNGNGCLILPHYDNNNELCMIMFRPSKKVAKGEKKCWKEEGGKPVFFGMHLVTNFDMPLVICEGQMDALALCESGIENVVSVPCGTNNLECIDTCWEWLENFNKIILFGDSDVPGQEMVEKLISKLGAYRCAVVNNTTDCKDANEILVKHGPDMLMTLVLAAKDASRIRLVNLNSCKKFDFDSLLRIKTGFQQIDSIAGGLMGGELIVLTGNNASGKSTLAGQLGIECVSQDHSVCVYSGELTPALYRYWIDLQTAGNKHITFKFDQFKQKDVPTIDLATSKRIEAFRGNKWYLYESELSTSESELIETFVYAATRHNCKLFIVDNLMTMILDSNNLNQAQSSFVTRLKAFAVKYDVCIILVAHPKKTDSEKITKNDIKGTGDITNLADSIFSMNRMSPTQIADLCIDATTTLDVLKHRFDGVQDIIIPLKFDGTCKRFAYYRDSSMLDKDYLNNNKNTNWWEQGDILDG